ncbi:MAG: 3-isopropylmalate dehydrogenase [Polyangiaceae bacterium]|nr:3-isopropylmalate dehydrogenase [Polyangiaceae bacterium]
MIPRIVLLPGDGVGPEVVGAARAVLEAVGRAAGRELAFEEHPIGGSALDACGEPLPAPTLAACRDADAILLGAVGGPRWDDPRALKRPEQGLLGLRKELGLFANLRPVRAVSALLSASPLREERVIGTDLVVVRELTGGLYFGEPRGRTATPEGRRAVDTLVYTDIEIRRVAQVAFDLARKRRRKVTSVDKANVLDSSRLWREVVVEVARDYPDVELEHQLVDSCAMRLVTAPAGFDVLVMENMFGDILSDEASVLAGSLGMLPSASLGATRRGLYEPIHGSAPDIAGQGVANPLGTILSAAMLLELSLGWADAARAVEQAVEAALARGARTRDLGGGTGALSTSGMTEAILRELTAPAA